MSTEKVRVYELAKKLDLPNKEVIKLLNEKTGIVVKSHASSITQEEANELISKLKPAKTPAEKQTPATQGKPAPKTEFKKQQQGDKPQYSQGTRPGFQQGDRPQRPQGARPGFQQGDRPQRPQGARPGYQQGDRPQRPQGARPGFQQGDRPQYSQGTRPGYQQGDRPQRPQGTRPGYQQGDRPQYSQGARPGYQQGDRPQRPQGARPGYQQGDRPQRPQGARPGYQQGDRPQRPQGARPGFQQGDRPQRPQGDRPGFQPQGDRPQRPDDRPVKRQFVSDMPSANNRFAKPKKKSIDKFAQDKKAREEKAKIENQQKFLKKKQKAEIIEEKVSKVVINQPLTVGELAEKMKLSAAEIVKTLMMEGVLATVNQTIDVESAKKVAKTLEMEVLDKEEATTVCDSSTDVCEEVDKSKLVERAPVVTIMGHVDHGKTTLLDAIRASKHKIVKTEVGGITQSIGAYSVKLENKKIVFIDTPGHEAFTEMRARGAQATDVAILVVAADDGIMPQTIEAINHAKAAKVPIIIAVNKMDKPTADPDRVLQQLTEHGLVPEEWGGDTITVKVSALQATGLDELLEYILLVSEVQELKSNPDAIATGVVIEAKLDKGKGPVATLLVQNGTLSQGDCVVVGSVGGKVRALISDEGERLKKAGPSTPVEILGLSEVPQSGDRFEATACERDMKAMVAKRKDEEKASKLDSIAPSHVRKDLIETEEDTQDLNLIIKSNTHGSAEAVSAAIQQLQSKQIFTKIVHIAVGDISEADVMLASASNAIIIGFGVKEDQNALRIAEKEDVTIKKYDIIYQILEDIEKTMLGMLQAETKEVEIGKAEVRQVFTVGKTVKIAGCMVTEGKIIRNKQAAVIRNGKEVFKGTIGQLKRFKDDVKEVATGYECGISFDKFNDIQEGDIIQAYTIEEVKRASLV